MGKSYKNRGNVLSKAQKLSVHNYASMAPSEQKLVREDLVRSGFGKLVRNLNPTRSDRYNHQKRDEVANMRVIDLEEQEYLAAEENFWREQEREREMEEMREQEREEMMEDTELHTRSMRIFASWSSEKRAKWNEDMRCMFIKLESDCERTFGQYH